MGSGKSLLMTFLAGRAMHHPELENPTLLVLTDRNDLDNQLFTTFGRCRDILGEEPVQAESVTDLQAKLDRQVGGVVFSTIQKFRPEAGGVFPEITSRSNVIVMVDEAHRTQYGFDAKFTKGCDFDYFVLNSGGLQPNFSTSNPNAAGLALCDISGKRLPLGSKHQLNGSVDWEAPVSARGISRSSSGNLPAAVGSFFFLLPRVAA